MKFRQKRVGTFFGWLTLQQDSLCHPFKQYHLIATRPGVTAGPSSLPSHLTPTSVSMRSSTSQLLAIPRHNLSFGSRSFRISAPRIWNSLTPQIRQCQTLATFRCHLKTHYFQSAFSATQRPSSYACALILSETSALYKSFTYLLTYLLTLCVDCTCTRVQVHSATEQMLKQFCSDVLNGGVGSVRFFLAECRLRTVTRTSLLHPYDISPSGHFFLWKITDRDG